MDAYQLAFDFYKNKNYKKAIEYYIKVLSANPNSPNIHSDAANAYFMNGDLDKAEKHYSKAIKLEPNGFSAYNNMGNVYCERGDYKTALYYYKKSMELNPDYLTVYINLGLTAYKLGQIPESAKYYEYILSKDTNNILTRWNYSSTLLTLGNYLQGWENFEYRFKSGMLDPVYVKNPWNGCLLNGKSIFICAEQGFGDTLQFARYIPLVKEFGGKVIFGCQPELVSLLKTVEGIDEIIPHANIVADYDIHLLSLPHIFKTTIDTIPNNIPYIHVDYKPIDIIQNQTGLKVGLVWAGNPRKDIPQCNTVDKRRSMKLKQFKSLTKIDGISLFSLQMPNTEAFKQIKDINIINVMNDVKDFKDTANIIQNLDLLISVDTSIVHLAGAIGKPVWLLSRFDGCWRWMNKSDSPWYPTMKIFKQPSIGNWETVINDVEKELRKIS